MRPVSGRPRRGTKGGILVHAAVGEAARGKKQDTARRQVSDPGSDCSKPFDGFGHLETGGTCKDRKIGGSGPCDVRPVKIGFEAEQPVLIDLIIVATLQTAQGAMNVEKGGGSAGPAAKAATGDGLADGVVGCEGD